MARLSDIEDTPVTGEGGVRLGKVEHVLFHPSAPRAVGLMIVPPAAAGVVKRPSAYVGLAGFSVEEGAVVVPGKKLPARSKAEAVLGDDPDRTVIWARMPVTGPDGEVVGTISDVRFRLSDGEVVELEVTAGATADLAHGRMTVPGEAIEGFRDAAVRVTRTFSQLGVSGGFAKTAATGAAVVSVKTEKVRAKASDAVADVAGKTGKAIRSVKEGSVPDKARSTWRNMVDAFKDGMEDDA
jgi:uncharacterized protein YrrD